MRTLIALLSFSLCSFAGEDDANRKARIKGIRDYHKQGQATIPKIEPYLADADDDVRWEAVKAIADLGSQRSLDPLITATRDRQAEIQIRAVEGLVNFYFTGYMKSGFTGSYRRTTNALKGRFTDTNNDVIDPYLTPRPEVIEALGKMVASGSNMDARSAAARGLGILRGKAALNDLYVGLQSRNDTLMYESIIAIQKIRDPQAGPKVQFLLRDLDERVQIAAIETTGILRNKEALPDLRKALENGRNAKIQRAALTSISMMPDEASRPLYDKYFTGKDDGLRGAAAEGYARLKNPSDAETLQKAFEQETKMGPRLSMAFAAAMLGRNELTEFSPLQYLVNTLNSKLYRDSAEPLLAELARDAKVRNAVYPALTQPKVTKEEKLRLARIFGLTGDRDTIRILEPLKQDSDGDVATAGTQAIRNITARLP